MPVPAASLYSRRFVHGSVIGTTVAVFGAVVAIMTLQLRAGLHGQILRREAELLGAAASMQLDYAAEEAERAGLKWDEVPGALFVAVIKTQKLAGVAGLRLYDAEQRISDAWMLPPSDRTPPADVWKRIVAGEASGRLHAVSANEDAADLVFTSPVRTAVEAWVPLRRSGSTKLIGAAQFWLGGEKVTQNFAEHDRRLWTQAIVAWLTGSAVIVLALGWAFRRLETANRELRMRSEDLQRANRELVLAAKTSALGAVTAHLMHELKNPLAGLELIMAGHLDTGSRSESAGGSEMAAASELTRRLRTMVNDVVGVLHDEQTGAEFELSAADVVDVVRAKVQADANARGVTLEMTAPAEISFAGRRANLATLVLRNLLQNALEATPRGRVVSVVGTAGRDGSAEFLVEDGGGGLPAAVRSRLFQPCVSTKPGGSGLGLALSHQLAHQAGGRLELVRSDERGTSFRLVLKAEA